MMVKDERSVVSFTPKLGRLNQGDDLVLDIAAVLASVSNNVLALGDTRLAVGCSSPGAGGGAGIVSVAINDTGAVRVTARRAVGSSTGVSSHAALVARLGADAIRGGVGGSLGRSGSLVGLRGGGSLGRSDSLVGLRGGGGSLGRSGSLLAVKSRREGASGSLPVTVARDDAGILVPAGRAVGTGARYRLLSTLEAGLGADLLHLCRFKSTLIKVRRVSKNIGIDLICGESKQKNDKGEREG